MIISITIFEVKNFWYLPYFMWHASQSARQVRLAPGLIHQGLKSDLSKKTFWTLSAWETEQDLKRFVWNAAHWKAMKSAQSLAKTMGSYRYSAAQIPDWEEAIKLLENHVIENATQSFVKSKEPNQRKAKNRKKEVG